MKDDFWHMQHDFLSSAPRDVVRGILEDDKKNYKKAEAELNEELALLNDALTFFISSLQGGYRNLEQWKDNISVKAAVAMANSDLNYLLLARHAVVLGYFPECRDLLRSCHERITRCYLFFVDKDEAKRFFTGKKIKQSDVRTKLSSILASGNDERKSEILKMLRESYSHQCEVVHPNLESLSARTNGPETEKLSERVVKYPFWGGMLSSDSGKLVIFTVIQATLFALKVIGVIFEETSGTWNKEFDRILQSYNTFLKQVREFR
jgi:hypothetical protein